MEFLKWCRNEWERTVGAITVVIGVIAFVLGFLGQRDKTLVTEQIPYVVSGALLGLLLVVIGTTVWLSADLHDEWVKLDRVEASLGQAVTLMQSGEFRPAAHAPPHSAADGDGAAPAVSRSGSRVRVESMPAEVRG